MRLCAWVIVGALLGAGTPTGAAAGDGPLEDTGESDPLPITRDHYHVEFVAELAYFRGSGAMDGVVADGAVLSPLFEARGRVHPNLELEFMWGFSRNTMGALATPFGRLDLRDQQRTGNPYFAAHYLGHTGRVRWQIGGGGTVPLGSEGDGFSKASMLATLGTRGMWNIWLWTESMASLVIPAAVEIETASGVRVGLEAAGALLVPTDAQRGPLGIATQAAAKVTFEPLPGLLLSSRFTAVWLVGAPGDNAQLALEPAATVDFGSVAASVSAVLNLDAPFGFAFDRHGLWGLHARLTARR